MTRGTILPRAVARRRGMLGKGPGGVWIRKLVSLCPRRLCKKEPSTNWWVRRFRRMSFRFCLLREDRVATAFDRVQFPRVVFYLIFSF